MRSSRGENWVEDSCSATTVSPSVNAITVITVPVTSISRLRASSAVPWKAIRERDEPGCTLICDSADPATSASTAATLGITQSAPFAYSRRPSHRRAR